MHSRLILLPPSEGKAVPSEGAPVDLDALVFAAELGERRARLLDALEKLGTVSTARALKQLDISKGQVGEIAVDATLRSAPAAPAAEVYTGVLYDHLRLPALPAKARRRVLIASALWGVVRPGDRIPYYRFSAKARLARIGAPAAYWRAGAGAGNARRARRAADRHALGLLRRCLEAEAGDPAGGAGVQREQAACASPSPTWRRRCAATWRGRCCWPRRAADPEAAAAIVRAAGYEVELARARILDVIVRPS